jgi:ketosteroid isomerase-like protein
MMELEAFMATGYPAWLAAVNAFHQGDVEAWLAVWSRNEPVSVLGAVGADRFGRAALEDLMPAVAARFVNLDDTEVDVRVVEVSGDFAYTVGYERTKHTDGSEPTVLRVTQIFRRDNGEWKLAHRHGDPEPVDKIAAASAQ